MNRICSSLIALLTLVSCSIRKYQPEGERLYLGIKEIKIERRDKSDEGDKAIAEAEKQLAYAPNNAIFGSSNLRWPLPLIGPWLYLRYQGATAWPQRWWHQLGSKPVWVSDVSPAARAQVAARVLREHGYLRAKALATEHPLPSDSSRARIGYQIDMGIPFRYDSIDYLAPIDIGYRTFEHAKASWILPGDQFNTRELDADRELVEDYLRQEGFYYFRANHISYEADTLQTPGKVHLRAKLNAPEGSLSRWKIGRVEVRLLDPIENGAQSLQTERMELDSLVRVYYNGKLPVRPAVLNKRIRLRPGKLYRQAWEDFTLRSLSKIGAFSSIEFMFSPETDSLQSASDSLRTLNLNILLRPDKPFDAYIGAHFMRKSNNFMGPGLRVGLDRRNLFGGGEVLSTALSTSYEWQTGNASVGSEAIDINSYQLGADIGLTFPTLLIPGRMNAYYPFPTSTNIKLSGQLMNRARYYSLASLGLGLSYEFTLAKHFQHRFSPLSISYSQLRRTTNAFDQILSANPSLGLSLRSQLIPKMSYSLTYDNALVRDRVHHLWVNTELSQSGNLTNLLSTALGSRYNETKNIMGVPFAQFIKLASELRYTYRIDYNQHIATRLGVGAIYSYGNMHVAPYTEQFFVGGANSIRAFTVRSLGPGSYQPQQTTAYTFMDRVGELKLEANIEYRGHLFGDLEAAVFMDAGNIWMLRPDASRPGGSIEEVGSLGKFLNQIAVGTGAGLRYDMDYLVIRFDVGIGLHLPYQTSRKGWYNIPRFRDAIGYHIAIGYPF